MALSIFGDKSSPPTPETVMQVLAERFNDWQNIIDFVLKNHPKAEEVWNFAGKSFGWSLRIKDSKRVIVYLTPGNKLFLVSLVFGKKATEEAYESNLSPQVISIIENAKVYAEGRGFRIEIINGDYIPDIIKLIGIKLRN